MWNRPITYLFSTFCLAWDIAEWMLKMLTNQIMPLTFIKRIVMLHNVKQVPKTHLNLTLLSFRFKLLNAGRKISVIWLETFPRNSTIPPPRLCKNIKIKDSLRSAKSPVEIVVCSRMKVMPWWCIFFRISGCHGNNSISSHKHHNNL